MNTAPNLSKDLTRHPCFNKDAKGSCGRVHLPVAPKCNILCNYCNRKYDCVNESRPGVSSAVLSPSQAAAYMDEVLAAEPRITVVGIAGPGDPMAQPEKVLETIRLIRAKHPKMLFCMSSNGLRLAEHVDELVAGGVSHVTVTVNAVDPEVGKNIYSWVRDGKVIHRGKDAAELLLSRQVESIRRLKAHGLMVKVNTIVIPGYNDHHVEEIAAFMKDMGVDIHNLIPLVPTADTKFADVPEPDKAMINELRKAAGRHVHQMTHCKRCRADAVGLLDKDRSGELAGCLQACSRLPEPAPASRPYVAVASLEGMLVNQHLGEAPRLLIYEQAGGAFRLVEERQAPEPGGGIRRWKDLGELLRDCRALLASAMGDAPRAVLEQSGVKCHEVEGFIDAGLDAVFNGGNAELLRGRRKVGGCAAGGCSGGGEGC